MMAEKIPREEKERYKIGLGGDSKIKEIEDR